MTTIKLAVLVSTLSLVFFVSGCASSHSLVLRDIPEQGFNVAPIPSDKYSPGSIVFMDRGAVVKVAQILPDGNALQNTRLGSGEFAGDSDQAASLNLALQAAGIPVGGSLDAKFDKKTTYDFKWDEATRDTVLLTEPTYQSRLLKWLDENSTNSLLAGKNFLLIQEAMKAKVIDLTITGSWDNSYGVSLQATIANSVNATSTAAVTNASNQKITIHNKLELPIYVSYMLFPLRVQKGLAGQRSLDLSQPPQQLPFPTILEELKTSN